MTAVVWVLGFYCAITVGLAVIALAVWAFAYGDYMAKRSRSWERGEAQRHLRRAREALVVVPKTWMWPYFAGKALAGAVRTTLRVGQEED